LKDKVIEVDNCRLCHSKNLSLVLSLPPTPIGDKFLKQRKIAISLETHNLDLVLCKNCGQIQLTEIIEPKQVYDEDYLYTTDVSVGLPEHFKKSCKNIINRFDLKKNDLVLEFGSNNGIMLNAFKENGMKVLGVDPVVEVAMQAIKRGVETKISFFTNSLAQEIINEYGKAKVIIANNVIANIPDLNEIGIAISNLLDHNGIFIFETSYALDVFQKHLIDTIYHEHISYLSVKPLNKFFSKFGLKLFDIERISTKGGSLRGFVTKNESSFSISANVRKMIEIEELSGIFDLKIYKNIEKSLENYKNNIIDLIFNVKDRGEDVACYGASVGCITMMYYFDMNKYVDYLLDDNPVKYNKFSPGYGIPVFNSEVIYEKENLKKILVLAWRYIQPILKKHQKFLDRGGKFLVLDLSKLEIIEYPK